MFPWNGCMEVYYPITDRSAPKNVEQFKQLIDWTIAHLKAGKKVHAGCIGGHGRTGLFFAALVKTLGITDDAITYVRKNYCKKAVESKVQVEFLVQNFGIKAVEMSDHVIKSYPSAKGTSVGYYTGSSAKNGTTITPVATDGCIFGPWI